MIAFKDIITIIVAMELSATAVVKIMAPETRKMKTSLDSNPSFYCTLLSISRELINGEL